MGCVVLSAVEAANWAVLAAGSKSFENYRHQADLFHLYQVLVSKGFKKDQIITLAYDDVKDDPDNPFPGKVFNMPDATGPGVDVRDGVALDYSGEDVTVANFAGVLLGNGTTGGSGRMLDLEKGDDVFIFYVDHGAPGILEFPDGDVLHAVDFQDILTQMHGQGKYGRVVVYIEACESGSILENLPADMHIYGVTAVGPDKPSLGCYCGYEAVINGTQMGSCLGDLFAVHVIDYIAQGDGSHTMGDFFTTVFNEVASYAALHYNNEEGRQYGDVDGFANFTLSQFLYPDAAIPTKLPLFVKPREVFSSQRQETERLQQMYTEASALPLHHGEWKFQELRKATNRLQHKLQVQENIQEAYWRLIKSALPHNKKVREDVWRSRAPPKQPSCEKQVHNSLVKHCGKRADMTTAYALQFHQVVVNLCAEESLGWAENPKLGKKLAKQACLDGEGAAKTEVASQIVV